MSTNRIAHLLRPHHGAETVAALIAHRFVGLERLRTDSLPVSRVAEQRQRVARDVHHRVVRLSLQPLLSSFVLRHLLHELRHAIRVARRQLLLRGQLLQLAARLGLSLGQ